MELVYVALISTVGAIFITLLLDRRQDKRFDYELKRFSKSKKAQKELKQMDLSPRHVPTMKEDVLKKLIDKGAEYLQGDNIEDEEMDPLETIINYARSNPDLVKRFLGGATGGEENKNEVSALR